MKIKTAILSCMMGLTLCFGLAFLPGCSASSMVEIPKEESFYTTFQNPPSESAQAAQRIEQIKLLTVGDEYPIRLALFKNGTFYYQVDKLGNGYGTYKYQDGGLKLTTKRRIFDMNFYVSAADMNGDGLIVKFFDSKGHNEFRLEFRNPEANSKLEKLREFKSSNLDI